MSEVLRCMVVDDEPMALALLERYVLRTPFLELVKSCQNGVEVLDYLHMHASPDLIFMDIQMPDLSGIQLSRSISNDTKIVFTTAFEQYAVDGYKVNALDYLLKPIDYAEFLSAAHKAKDWFEIYGKAHKTQNTAKQDNFIFVKSEYKQLKINLKDIAYIEGLKDYVKIHLIHEDSPVLSLISLKKLEEVLPVDSFMRVHRSYIVALDKIEQVERHQVIIKGERITIAEHYRPEFYSFIEHRSV